MYIDICIYIYKHIYINMYKYKYTYIHVYINIHIYFNITLYLRFREYIRFIIYFGGFLSSLCEKVLATKEQFWVLSLKADFATLNTYQVQNSKVKNKVCYVISCII